VGGGRHALTVSQKRTGRKRIFAVPLELALDL
jgi:hypothetical protein